MMTAVKAELYQGNATEQKMSVVSEKYGTHERLEYCLQIVASHLLS